jgi:hypothetical protein
MLVAFGNMENVSSSILSCIFDSRIFFDVRSRVVVTPSNVIRLPTVLTTPVTVLGVGGVVGECVGFEIGAVGVGGGVGFRAAGFLCR